MSPDPTDLSMLGHLLQCIGIVGLALLFYLLNRAMPVRYFRYWALAWLAMTMAMLGLQLVFNARPHLDFVEFFYFFGEYLFALFMWAGFAAFPKNNLNPDFKWFWAVALLVLWSACLTFYPLGFGERFTVHALTFSLSLLPSLWLARRLPMPASQRWVKYAASSALILLSGVFFLNGLSLLSEAHLGPRFAALYSAYQSIFDVLIEMYLAFSMLAIAGVNVLNHLERSNKALESERDRMAMLAHLDALTGCFNRHAMTQLDEKIEAQPGMVGVVDINDLKVINDVYGHLVGDTAIVRVAQGVRLYLRENDYIFRYGGDEFVWVAFDLSRSEARARMRAVEQFLKHSKLSDDDPFTVTISWGIANFDAQTSFDEAVHQADQAMYQQKSGLVK